MSQRKSESNHDDLEEVEMGVPVTQKDVEEEKPRLNHKNYLNAIFYALNIAFTYGVGNAGWFGGSSNGELSRKYQTIVTPSSKAFIIWAVIFVFQGIFTVLQLLPRFGALPVVQKGVGYWYLLVCTFQVGWTFAFAYEVVGLALFFMFMIWGSLMALAYSQYYTESSARRWVEFWFFQFPFALHGGWITAASALNVNVLAVFMNAQPEAQLAIGIVSLAVLHAVSVWVLFVISKPNYTIAGVLSWANGWIYSELQSPGELITATFDAVTISGVSYAALAVSVIIAVQIVVRVGISAMRRFFKKDGEDDDSTNREAASDESE